jgi:ADP-ribose pyrophosphatase
MSDDPASAQVLQHRRVHSGKVLDLDVDDVLEPGGVRGRREVVRQRGSVAALPVHDDGRVVLVRQYRYAVDAFVWELPAGRRDPGETPEEGALRELEEEVGLRATALEPLLEFWTTPGFCDEVMHLFRATGLQPVPPRPEADENIESATFTLEEAMAMVRRGEIREGKTLVALLLEAGRRGGTSPERAVIPRSSVRVGRRGICRAFSEA